jgi:hypothetical protein
MTHSLTGPSPDALWIRALAHSPSKTGVNALSSLIGEPGSTSPGHAYPPGRASPTGAAPAISVISFFRIASAKVS